MLKSVAEMLDDSVITVPDRDDMSSVLGRLRSMKPEEKWQRAYEYRMRGVPASSIAKMFEVDTSTVHRWLASYNDAFCKELEKTPAANLIAGSVQILESLEEMCLYEADQAGGDERPTIDEKTGELIRKSNSSLTKLKYLQAALNARQTIIKLFIDTGVMPKAPDRLYHAMESEKRLALEDTHLGDGTTPEEMKNRILDLVKNGRRI